MSKNIIDLLNDKKLTISVSESITGGAFSSYLTSFPSASKVFEFGVVTYSNVSKNKILNIPNNLIEKYGSISKEVSIEMAKSVKRISNSNLSISFTGNAGPTSNEGKEVGLVYICFINVLNEFSVHKFNFRGTRREIISEVVSNARNILEIFLNK